VGAHVCAQRPPAVAEGYITSSCYSPILGHPVALAMLERGRQRLGEHITVWHMGTRVEAEVVATPIFDKEGKRLHGL
jgi:sarcosine oxidase subunit alpha